MFAMMRSQLGNMTLAQGRYIHRLTTPVYLSFAKDKGFPPDSITLSDGVQAHWIGNKNAQKTIVYFHGTTTCYTTLYRAKSQKAADM